MQIELHYGRGQLPVTPPAGCLPTVIRKPPMPLLADPIAAVEQALSESPQGSLEQVAGNKQSACIVICDITRPVPNHLFLPTLVRRLLAHGMAAHNIKILVATGLHRPNENVELQELIGDDWVMHTVPIFNHFARDAAGLIDLGKTPKRRVPVQLNRHFVEADLRIVTGLVEPHFMAGYSGGRKVVAPGIAGQETIRTFHNAAFMGHPNAVNCRLEGNPLHEEQLAIVEMAGPIYALNTVIDEQRRLAFVNFGTVVASHLQAVEFVRPFVEIPFPRRFKTVVTSAAGYPLDKTYYQTVKGMVGPLEILEPGGNLIVASACEEGLGSKEFAAAQRRLMELGWTGYLNEIAANPLADIDAWQTQMQTKSMKRGRIELFTDGLSDFEFALTGVRRIRSVETAVAESIAKTGAAEVAFIPEGPYVVPSLIPPRSPIA